MKAIGAGLLTGLLVLTACSTPDPDAGKTPPAVGAAEIAQRLDEYLTGMAGQTLESDAQAGPITRGQTTGCTENDVSWGVVPHAERMVTAGAKAGKYYEDLDSWLSGSGLSEYADLQVDNAKTARGVSREGVRLTVRWVLDSPQLTISATGPCSWPADRPGGPAPGHLPSPAAPKWPRSEGYPTDRAVCTSPRRMVFSSDAPPFAGPAPHLTAVIPHADGTDFLYSDPILDEDWAPSYSPVEDTPEESNTQLVACVRVEATADSGRDLTCHYSDSPVATGGAPHEFDLFEANYHVTVRQARDGAVVEQFTLPGTVGDGRTCPDKLYNSYPKLALGLDSKALAGKLRPLAESPR
ncbi:hypothetical protein [Amycolatopsis sp. YIM 10]|uniref:hypothetical protein n=1 Tax=Amycolatopsis sp. YIM 10 TaxID=2653857 RepID=UPI00128FE509|nr:hypothetical protein [Amycolatopsis sp. YIM 10]